MGKKGEITQNEMYVIVQLVMLAIVIVSLFYMLNSVIGDKTLERNYISTDSAMLISAIYASPFDIDYYYSNNFRKNELDVKSEKNKVVVSDKMQESS